MTPSKSARTVISGATMDNFKPLGRRVVVRVEQVNQITGGGIQLPDSVSESQRPARGYVVDVSEDCKTVGVGDYAVFMMYAGSFVEAADEAANTADSKAKTIYRIVREEEVFGVWRNGTWKYETDSPTPAK